MGVGGSTVRVSRHGHAAGPLLIRGERGDVGVTKPPSTVALPANRNDTPPNTAIIGATTRPTSPPHAPQLRSRQPHAEGEGPSPRGSQDGVLHPGHQLIQPEPQKGRHGQDVGLRGCVPVRAASTAHSAMTSSPGHQVTSLWTRIIHSRGGGGSPGHQVHLVVDFHHALQEGVWQAQAPQG